MNWKKDPVWNSSGLWPVYTYDIQSHHLWTSSKGKTHHYRVSTLLTQSVLQLLHIIYNFEDVTKSWLCTSGLILVSGFIKWWGSLSFLYSMLLWKSVAFPINYRLTSTKDSSKTILSHLLLNPFELLLGSFENHRVPSVDQNIFL